MEAITLRKLLEENGIKQKWVASKLNVSCALVNQWVKGTKSISESKKKALSVLFN